MPVCPGTWSLESCVGLRQLSGGGRGPGLCNDKYQLGCGRVWFLGLLQESGQTTIHA